MEQTPLFQTEITGVDRDHALARFTDPSTSHRADVALRSREGAANVIRKGTHRHRVLVCFDWHERTADEVQQITGIEGIWKRVSDLKNMGFLAPTGALRLSRAGRQQDVLALTSSGREALEHLA